MTCTIFAREGACWVDNLVGFPQVAIELAFISKLLVAQVATHNFGRQDVEMHIESTCSVRNFDLMRNYCAP